MKFGPARLSLAGPKKGLVRAFCDEQHTRREGAGRLKVMDAYLVSSARGDHHPRTQPLINVRRAGGESCPFVILARNSESVDSQSEIRSVSHPITVKHCKKNAAVNPPREILFARFRSPSGEPSAVSLSANSR